MSEIPNTAVAIAGDQHVSLELGHLSPMIAAELAAGLSSPASIRQNYGLTDAQWALLAKNPTFRAMLADAMKNFKGDLNAGNRITLKSEILLEDALPELHKIALSKTSVASDRIAAVKELANLAGRNIKKDDGQSKGGGGFVLNINLDGQKGVTINGKPTNDHDG